MPPNFGGIFVFRMGRRPYQGQSCPKEIFLTHVGEDIILPQNHRQSRPIPVGEHNWATHKICRSPNGKYSITISHRYAMRKDLPTSEEAFC